MRVVIVVLVLLTGCARSFKREPESAVELSGVDASTAGQGSTGGAGGVGGSGGQSGAGASGGSGGMSGAGGNGGMSGQAGNGGMSGQAGNGGIGSILVLCSGMAFIPCFPVASPNELCCTASNKCGTRANSMVPCN